MAMKAPRGTADLLPSQARAWNHLAETAFRTFSVYGYEPIETPTFEQLDVFTRGIGESTDVIEKEMFHVLSKNAYEKLLTGQRLKADQRLALRPEGTAGVVRAIMEHTLVPQGAAPVKLMYAGSMYRCERPQKGRLREFHQIGVECMGTAEPSADAEVIIMLMRFFTIIGIPMPSMRLLINSMGDDACRPAYRIKVKEYIHKHADELCEECNRRADSNPLRAFDCKNPACQVVMAGAPLMSDELCDDCRDHYAMVKRYLDDANIAYEEDPRLVRGLDYYTRTVFEVQVLDGLGSQNAIGGGGRYDKLMETVGGKPTPGLGFALGFERTVLALEAAGVESDPGCDLQVYVAAVDSTCRVLAFTILQSLRDSGIASETDHQNRSLKSQFKMADKMGAALCVLVGPDEAAVGEVVIRVMDTHEERRVPIDHVLAAVQSLLGIEPV